MRNQDYQAFIDKFKPKRTTDDCITPANIYDAIADWVAREYGLNRADFVRPFWPGGDYESYTYPSGSVVVDNPPFSCLARIIRFYGGRSIPFFLFAPTLTLFSGREMDVSYLPVGVQITYDNGAKVNTSFITSLEDCRVRSVPELYSIVRRVNDANEKAQTKELPRYIYPPHVLTAAAAYQYSHYGVEYRLEKDDCVFIHTLDDMRAVKKSGIFGGAFLLSETAAAERAAAERAAAERAAAERAAVFAAAERAAAHTWELSDREWAIIEGLESARRVKHDGIE